MGGPLSIYDFSDPSGTSSAEPRPNCIAPSQETLYAQNPNSGQNGYLWFNPTTMAHPALELWATARLAPSVDRA